MKLKYLNGEKVYVEEETNMMGFEREWDRWNGTLQVIRHRDLIKCLNRLFKDAEENTENVGHSLWTLLYGMGIHFDYGPSKPKWDIFDKDKIVFDDDNAKIKTSRGPQLYTGTSKSQNAGKFKVYKGGSYQPPVPRIEDDILTNEGRDWLSKERSGKQKS